MRTLCVFFLLKAFIDPFILSGFISTFIASICWMAAMPHFELTKAFMSLAPVLVFIFRILF
jgi:hypothetical protein